MWEGVKVQTTSFYNIEKPEHNKGNNNLRLNDIKLIILINKTHYIFNKIQPAKQIIKYIQNLIKNESLTHKELKSNIKKVIKDIPKEKYENIIKGTYNRTEKYVKKPSNRRNTLKNYK